MNIAFRLKLLEFLATFETKDNKISKILSISTDHLELLWSDFIESPVKKLDSSKFMSWLYKSCDSDKNPFNLILSKNCIIHLF